MSQIRVAQVVRPAAGGIRRHVSLLMAHLDREEFAPTVFGPSVLTFDPPLLEKERVPFAIQAVTSPVSDLRSIVSLARLLHGKFDLVHAHGLRGALIGVLAARLAGIPSLFTAHNLIESGSLLQRLTLRTLGGSAAAIIAVSQAVADSLALQGVARAKITVIPNGVDLSTFSRRDTSYNPDNPQEREISCFLHACRSGGGKAPLVAAIGRLSPEKGFDVLIDAFTILLEQLPEARLILAGTGHKNREIRAQVNDTHNIHLAGELPDVIPLLFAADVVAIPSRQEGQGIVALEAMAAGKPVVASRVGGLVETVLDGETGLLVPPNDPAALAQALFQILTDKDGSLSMGQAGRIRVEQEYTLEKMMRRTIEIYRNICRDAG